MYVQYFRIVFLLKVLLFEKINQMDIYVTFTLNIEFKKKKDQAKFAECVHVMMIRRFDRPTRAQYWENMEPK